MLYRFLFLLDRHCSNHLQEFAHAHPCNLVPEPLAGRPLTERGCQAADCRGDLFALKSPKVLELMHVRVAMVVEEMRVLGTGEMRPRAANARKEYML